MVKKVIPNLSNKHSYLFYEKRYQQLTKENDKLTKENDKLTKENDKLTKENDKLTEENDLITSKYDKLEFAVDSLPKEKECPVCGDKFPFFLPYFRSLGVECPNCGAHERQRMAYLYLKNQTDIFKRNIKMLHFAPEPIFYEIFSNSKNIDYLTADIEDYPIVHEVMDIQDIPYDDNTFDVIYSSHVLEHVPDDLKAMKEMLRVLKNESQGSYALIQVPINHNSTETLEKEEYDTPELREKYYGQSNHLRYYGLDFPSRLEKVGFKVKVVTLKDLANEENLNKDLNKYGLSGYALFANISIYVCTK